MYLPDPRFYPRVNAQNPIVRVLMSYLTETDRVIAGQKRTTLTGLMADLLASNDHSSLNAVLTQAPSQEAYKVLWQLLRETIEVPDIQARRWAIPFAIPIILVAGSSKETALVGEVDAVAMLDALKDGGVVAEGAEIVLSGQLSSADQLMAIDLSQLVHWRDQCSDITQNLLQDHRPAPLKFKDEAVFLRYLVGIAIQHRGEETAIKFNAQPTQWALTLSKRLGDALKTDGVTLFPIPRPPLPWLAAIEAGRVTQLETRLQVATSNALRSIRSKGRSPIITMAGHEGGEIRITFSSREDTQRWEGFVWPLAPLDSVERIRHFAEDLFRECQVDEIRIIDTVQPDQDSDGLPFFVTAHTKPVTRQ